MITSRNDGSSGGDQICRRALFHGLVIEVTAPADPFARLLAYPFAGYSTPPAAAPAACPIEIIPAPGARADRWYVVVAGHRHVPAVDATFAARWAEALGIHHLLLHLPHVTHIHAAVIATDQQSVLLIGESGSGKSTTAVALALRGLALYTDDVALIERATHRPLVVPRPIKLDTAARGLLARCGLIIPPSARLGESVVRPALPGLPPLEARGPAIRTALFLTTPRQADPTIRPLSHAEALLRLSRQSLSERVAISGVTPTAVALVRMARCYEVGVGELAATVDAVIELGRRVD